MFLTASAYQETDAAAHGRGQQHGECGFGRPRWKHEFEEWGGVM
jgi:hypothetical protein